ncbi:MAG: hypothetical protein A2Y12_00595 [Planctomycetes bacterium GWF2_42_9]|nr:MAG: hypothetical protein A2Y12_00595 [Planctomycetes bacterium GWF2_42_9]
MPFQTTECQPENMSGPIQSQKKRVYYYFHQHRIGDKVAISAALKWYKEQHPQDWLIAVDDFWFENGKQRSIPSNIIFDEIVNECLYNTTPADATRLDFGCIWIRVPWLAQQGYYPSIKVSKECEEQMLSRFRWMCSPYVCVHILEDAPYNRGRNHNFTQMVQLMRFLSGNGMHVIRIGKSSGYFLKQQTDLTRLGLSVMESACIIKHSIAYIGGDTGMTHIASAVGVPWILAIYGPPPNQKPWRNHAKAIGCNVDFCSLPSVPKERRTVFYMHGHKFSLSKAMDTCVEHLFTSDAPLLRSKSP